MQVFELAKEASFRDDRHVENILATVADGDVSVACWSAGQVSPYHCHPQATEIYFCVQGGGLMRTPECEVAITPGSFVVHPPGEVHEYTNGPAPSLLFRVRYGADMASRHMDNRGKPQWQPRPADVAYFSALGIQLAADRATTAIAAAATTTAPSA